MADGESTAHAAAELESSIDPSARYQARIALITAIVALVSALLGPLVSLQINKSQIKSQGAQNRVSAKENAAQSEGEFVRTQRSEAYSDYLTAFNNSTLDLLGAAGAFGGGGDAKFLADQETKSVQAVKDVTAAYYQVKIVGSTKAVAAADALYEEFGTWSGALLTIGSLVLQGQGQNLSDAQQQLLLGTNDEYAKLIGLSNEFITKGRVDTRANVEVKDPDDEGDD